MRRHLADHLRVLHKRGWLAGGAFVLIFLYLAASSLRKTPLYEGTTQILIEKSARRAASLTTVLQDSQTWYDDFYQTQYAMLQSRALAWRTLQTLGLADAPAELERQATGAAALRSREGGWLGRLATWFGAPKAIVPQAGDETVWQAGRVDGFLNGLTVAPVRNSRLVNVRYVAADPVFAARAANALADAYIAQNGRIRALASEDAGAVLNVQLADQKQRLADSEQALQLYTGAHGVVSPADPANSTVVRELADTSAELTRARGERLEKEQVFETVTAMRQDPARLSTFPAILASPSIQAVLREIADLKAQDTTLAADFGEKYQKRKDIATQLAMQDAELQSQIGRIVASIGHDYEIARDRESALADHLKALEEESSTQDKIGMGYLALERAAAGNRQLYDDLLARAKATGVDGEYTDANVQVVDRADMPRVPILPNHERDLLVAFLAALLVASGLAFGLDYLDSRIRTADDVKQHLGLPFLGRVPGVRGKDLKGPSPLLGRGVPPAFAEAIRGIRTSVMFSTATEGVRTFMVTSTAPSEGKSVVSTNLADALAQAEQRTLIIDSDMRRPRVHDVFGCPQEPGLSNVLIGVADVQAAIRPTMHPLLFVLPAGMIPPNPAELLSSPQYRRLLEALGRDYDWIVVDAPPVMAVTDAAVIANGVGGVVFVVGSEMTPRRNAQVAIEQLVASRARLVGVVLNRAKVARRPYDYALYYRKDHAQAYARTR